MKIFYCLTLLFIPWIGYAQGQEGYQILITHDNDFLGIKNRDENYTGGLKIDVLTPELKKIPLPFFKFKGNSALNTQRFSFGGTAYTPQDLANPNVIQGDRPYASLTFLSIGGTSNNTDATKSVSTDLVLGLIGAPGPGNVQAFIHKHHLMGTDRPIPKGWHNQIGYNGSFVLNYNVRFQSTFFATNRTRVGHQRMDIWLKASPFDSSNVDEKALNEVIRTNRKLQWLQALWVGGVDVGNYMVNIQGGLRLNFLNINSFSFLNYNPKMPLFKISTQSLGKSYSEQIAQIKTSHRDPCFRLNLFFEPIIRYAAYNSTLEGLMFDDKSVYKIPHDEVRRILWEFNTGVNILVGNVLYLRYALYGRSQEYAHGKEMHYWGGVTIGAGPRKWNRLKSSGA